MSTSEASARIKINKLLEKAGWRFFDDEKGPANVVLEAGAKITRKDLDAFGNDFEHTTRGFLDFLLLDERGFPLVVLEAKREEKNPLVGKEQARLYAYSKNIRFVILSNGNIHYFWDIEHGNPRIITEFPRYESLVDHKKFSPNPSRLLSEQVDETYIVQSQLPGFMKDPRWANEAERQQMIEDEGLRILRKYQLSAIHALQDAARQGNERYLFEMATGTGKTLVSAAVIKLFLRTGNAKRVLFLVDRLELEDQAYKNFTRYLSNDYTTMVFKENHKEWRSAEIVVSTVQSLMVNDKFKRLFSPTDFDLIISDEAHRSISGNSRAVFEYFVGYKLGLTATPRNYLKHIDLDDLKRNDVRAWERRQLLDTYKTFGCESAEPTYRYSLLDGVKDGYLINPIVADARTEITTQLLSDEGYAVLRENEEGEEEEQTYFHRDFERKFFSDKTNRIFCETFMQHALRDPLTNEIGKSIVFCVSQDHAARITQELNILAHQAFPGKYNSDFAVQITSSVPNAQQFTLNFANNNLNGQTRFVEGYLSSRTRVCVTVGMMTTGYDCQDILNLCMMRPIFSPTDFIQIKGRGTRTFIFSHKLRENGQTQEFSQPKERFKLFDFFANCEYFEEKFVYDEALKLPVKSTYTGGDVEHVVSDDYENYRTDPLQSFDETPIGLQGMKIDRKLFEKLAVPVRKDTDIADAVDQELWDRAIHLFRERYENKPEDFVTLEKLKRAENLDRRLTWREVLERIFGYIDEFKSKDDLLEDEFQKFISVHHPDPQDVPRIRNYMKAYITDAQIREIVESRQFSDLSTNPKLSMADFSALNKWRQIVPEYVKDYVSLNTYL